MISVKKYNLRKLKRKFENRDFAIPEIQRQYVWRRRQVLKLFDSIFRNYPVGISLVWHAPFSKAIHIRPNSKTILHPFNKKAKFTELVIDGQQRLSTLFGIINGIEERPDAGSTINFKNVFFNCDKKSERRFVFSKKYDENTKGYIRLTDLINVPPARLKRRHGLTDWETKEAVKCYNAFHSYVFLILVYEGKNFSDIKEVFIRINSAGMRVSRADTLFARATNVNLRDNILDTKRGLNHGYRSISTEAMQSTLGLAYGASRITARDLESVLSRIERDRKDNKEFNRIWRKLQYGYEEAVDFLVNYLKVTNPSILPYPNIYALLSYFFYLTQSRAKPSQISEIKKWFWHTSCGERYSGASFNRNVPNDIKFFSRLARNPNAKYYVEEKINPVDFFKSEYNKASSSAKAYFLLLQIKRPAYLLNGIEMLLDKTSSSSNRKDRHHIFPQALLKRRNVHARWINSIVNICYLEADENQSISDTSPAKYLPAFKKLSHFGRVMRSHLIPYAANSPVWNNHIRLAFLKFINERGRLIVTAIEDIAGARIFEKLDNVKRI